MCLTRMLDSIQDNYTGGQPGIARMNQKLRQIILRVDPPLHAHLEEQGLADCLQFSFRWFNCLLAREFPIECVIRMFDT